MRLKPGTHWRQSRKDVQHSGDKFDRVGDNVDRDKLSNSSCCRSVANTGNKVDRIGNTVAGFGNSRLCCRFVAGFGNSRLSTKSTVLNSTLSPVCTGLKGCFYRGFVAMRKR